jgi:hypothetical protein
MPKCIDCRYEGPYNIRTDQKIVFHMKDGVAEDTMKYMRCQAPGGGPTQDPISFREAFTVDQPCDFFEPKEKPQPKKQGSSFLAKLFSEKKHKNVKFMNKMTQGPHTYEIYSARTKNEALDFLRSRSVTEQFYYIVVETPEGHWGLDTGGIYQEK